MGKVAESPRRSADGSVRSTDTYVNWRVCRRGYIVASPSTVGHGVREESWLARKYSDMAARRNQGNALRIGADIRRSRRRAGATQGDFARRLGVDRTTLGKWERDEAFPSPRGIRALRKAGVLPPWRGRLVNTVSKHRLGLSVALLDETMEELGYDRATLRTMVSATEDDGERALVVLFRRLSVEQREAVLRIIGALEVPTGPKDDSDSHQDLNG